MSEPIFYIDRSAIREGSLEEVRSRIHNVVEFIEGEEPQLLGYDFYVDEGDREMTVVSIHPDSASLELHLRVGRSAFQGFAALIELRSIEVYGRPSDEALALLEDKAAMLGEGSQVEIHDRQAGFLRFEAANAS